MIEQVFYPNLASHSSVSKIVIEKKVLVEIVWKQLAA